MSDFLRGLNFADREPELSHRFGVFFFYGGLVPNPIDIRFQKVTGLSAEVQLETVNEGGQNMHTHRLPGRMSYNNLVLERGYIVGSPLLLDIKITFESFKFTPANVLVTLFNEAGNPIGAWNVLQAYPVKWSVSELDAQSNTVLIDTMELAYTKIGILRV